MGICSRQSRSSKPVARCGLVFVRTKKRNRRGEICTSCPALSTCTLLCKAHFAHSNYFLIVESADFEGCNHRLGLCGFTSTSFETPLTVTSFMQVPDCHLCVQNGPFGGGVLEGIRTPDPRFRKPVLYPAELPRREDGDSTGFNGKKAGRLILGAFDVGCIICINHDTRAYTDMRRHHGAHAVR